MIYPGGQKKIVAIERPISAFVKRVFLEIRRGRKIIWSWIRSCYGGGFWDDTKPWLNDDYWKDG